MKKNRFGAILTSTALMLGATLATRERDAGAETNPRDYSALLSLPSHTVIFLGYYRHVSSSDTTSLSQDLELFRAAYTLKWNHFLLAPIDLILPVADTTLHVPIPNGGGLSGTLHNSGIGDLSFLPTAVYEIPEGDSWSTFLGASTYVTLPTGNYKDTQPINAGAHRWNFKQELMVGESLPHDQTIEALVNITDYTGNDDFRAPTKDIHSLHQLPTLGLEAHYYLAPEVLTVFMPRRAWRAWRPWPDKRCRASPALGRR